MKKIIIFILILIVSLEQFVYAAQLDSDIVSAKIVSQYTKETNYETLNSVQLGKYHQKGYDINEKQNIDWIILAKKDGNALLMSKYTIDIIPYHITNDFCNWENCYLRTWLNNDFSNYAFDESEKNC